MGGIELVNFTEKVSKKVKNIFFIMKYIWKTEKKYIIYRIPEVILKALDPFIMVVFPKMIIDRLMYSTSESLFQDIFLIILIMLLINLTIKSCLTIINTCITNAYNLFDAKHTQNIGKKVMSLEYKYIESPKILDIFQRTKSTSYCEDMYNAITNITANIITCIGLIAILYQLQIGVIIVIFLVVAINVICNGKTQQYNFQWHVEAAPYNRVADYLVRIMHGFQYGKEVRVYHMEQFIYSKFHTFSTKYLKALRSITRKYLKLNIISTVVNLLQEAGLYLYLSYNVIINKLTIGSFTMLLTSIQSLTNSLINISANVVSLSKSSYYIDEFCYILNLESQNRDGGIQLVKCEDFVIEFKHVSFRYPNCDYDVLKDINVTIDSKKKICVVGTNGSGKTTFIKLILRLYQPTKGTIELNGVNINDINYDSYMKMFASVFQDFRIFAYSLKENIAMSETIDETMLNKAVDQVNLTEKINSLPKKLDTVMFQFLDDEGIELSGGEQQKLVIARALYKDSPVLILDEPTAALDPLMEYEIYQAINNSIKNKCVIFISHRLSITKYCNEILVFDKGRIVQEGIHSKLMMEKDKLYYQMYCKQAEFYEDDGVA